MQLLSQYILEKYSVYISTNHATHTTHVTKSHLTSVGHTTRMLDIVNLKYMRNKF